MRHLLYHFSPHSHHSFPQALSRQQSADLFAGIYCVADQPDKVRHSIHQLTSILIPLFDRLHLDNNQLISLPDSIGQLTNLTVYVARFNNVWLQFSSLSLIGSISTITSSPLYPTVLGSWRIWASTTSISQLTSILITPFDRLSLGKNQLTFVSNYIGLTNLTTYDIQFVIWFQFSSLSLIGSLSEATSWPPYLTLLGSWPAWPCTADNFEIQV